MAEKTFSVMVNKDGIVEYPNNFITANSVATKTDLTNKQDKLSHISEGRNDGLSYIDLKADYINLGVDKTDVAAITIGDSNIPPLNIYLNSDTISGSAIATTIGTSETSAKLPTEGAIVKALKNVSGGTPDLSEYLKKSGDTTLSLGEFANEESNGRITVNYFDGNGSPISTNITGETISVAYADGPASTLNARLLNLFDGNIEALSIDSYDGFSGKLVDTSIPSSPIAGHIATTGAIKTYVDNKVASGGSAPTNMVTTDTEQTITGRKTFTGEIGISSIIGKQNTGISVSTFRDDGSENETFVSTPGTTILRAGHDVAEIPAEISIIYDYNDNSSKMSLTARNITIGSSEYSTENLDKLNIYSGGTTTYEYYRTNKFIDGYNFMYDNDMVLSLDGEKATFEIPQRLRVFDTVTKTWTHTYKYTYLAQDANGNVTLAISDTDPLDSV